MSRLIRRDLELLLRELPILHTLRLLIKTSRVLGFFYIALTEKLRGGTIRIGRNTKKLTPPIGPAMLIFHPHLAVNNAPPEQQTAKPGRSSNDLKNFFFHHSRTIISRFEKFGQSSK